VGGLTLKAGLCPRTRLPWNIAGWKWDPGLHFVPEILEQLHRHRGWGGPLRRDETRPQHAGMDILA